MKINFKKYIILNFQNNLKKLQKGACSNYYYKFTMYIYFIIINPKKTIFLQLKLKSKLKIDTYA